MIIKNILKALFFSLLSILTLFYIYQTINRESDEDKIIELYIATFNRVPTYLGLRYWLNEIKLNRWSSEKLAKYMFMQKEAKELYPDTISNYDFVYLIYKNIFNRKANRKELEYWAGELENRNIPRELFPLAIINGVKVTKENSDTKIFYNKLEIGRYFALKKKSNNLSLSKEIIKLVTPNRDSISEIKKIIDKDNHNLISFSSFALKEITYPITTKGGKFKPNYQHKLNGSIEDMVTGLNWQKEGHLFNLDSTLTYCRQLKLDGFNDWRLPSIKEIISLVDFNQKEIKLNPLFSFPIKEFYLGSSSFYETNQTTNILTIESRRGLIKPIKINFKNEKRNFMVLCVRGNRNYGFNKLRVKKEIVVDYATNLIWQKEDSKKLLTFEEAKEYCKNLEIEGYKNWRVPEIKELYSLLDYSTPSKERALIDKKFLSTPLKSKKYNSYWSNTIENNRPLIVNFGDILNYKESKKNFVRCVRDKEL